MRPSDVESEVVSSTLRPSSSASRDVDNTTNLSSSSSDSGFEYIEPDFDLPPKLNCCEERHEHKSVESLSCGYQCVKINDNHEHIYQDIIFPRTAHSDRGRCTDDHYHAISDEVSLTVHRGEEDDNSKIVNESFPNLDYLSACASNVVDADTTPLLTTNNVGSISGSSTPQSPRSAVARFRRIVDAVSRVRNTCRTFPQTPGQHQTSKPLRPSSWERVVAATRPKAKEVLDKVRSASALQARRLASHTLFESSEDLSAVSEAKSTPFPNSSFASWINRFRKSDSQSDSSDSEEESGAAASGILDRARVVLQRFLLARGGGDEDVAWANLPDSTSPSAQSVSKGANPGSREWFHPSLRACAERARRVLARTYSGDSGRERDGAPQEVVRLHASEDASEDEPDDSDDAQPSNGFEKRRSRSCSGAIETVVDAGAVRRMPGQKSCLSQIARKRRNDRRVTWCVPAQFRKDAQETSDTLHPS